jgi:hypothetical protein
MTEPPFLLDAARVVAFALIDPAMFPERTVSVEGGVPLDLDVVRGVAITESLLDAQVYLLHCTSDWLTLAAGAYADVASARAAADSAYPGLAAQWQQYRSLTAAEQAEIETTRAFLKDIAASSRA